MKTANILIALWLALDPHPSLAEINMKDGSFVRSWQDTAFLKRTYRSRSLHSGYFGYGWCSNLEKSLEARPNGDFVLKDCELEADILLTRGKKKIDEWVFRDQLFLTRESSGGFRLNKNKNKWIFNSTGKLVGLSSIKLEYKGHNISRIFDNKGQIWKVKWDPDGRRILSIGGPEQFSYRYQGDDLSEIESDDLQTLQYDSLHNLIQIKTRFDKQNETLTYNSQRDLVTSHLDSRTNCLEIFKYFEISKLHFKTLAEKHCGKGFTTRTQYDFWQRKLPLGYYVLEKMKISTKSKTTEYTFDLVTGEPIPTSRNAKIRIGENHD